MSSTDRQNCDSYLLGNSSQRVCGCAHVGARVCSNDVSNGQLYTDEFRLSVIQGKG